MLEQISEIGCDCITDKPWHVTVVSPGIALSGILQLLNHGKANDSNNGNSGVYFAKLSIKKKPLIGSRQFGNDTIMHSLRDALLIIIVFCPVIVIFRLSLFFVFHFNNLVILNKSCCVLTNNYETYSSFTRNTYISQLPQ